MLFRSWRRSVTAPGEAFALLLTAKPMAGKGRAVLPRDPQQSTWLFHLAGGGTHQIERRAVVSVAPVEEEPGALMIKLGPPWLLFGIAIKPHPSDVPTWLALAPQTPPER